MENKKYDISISFAGEDRPVAEEIAFTLRGFGLKIFYDKFEQHLLLGKNLFDELLNVYKNESIFVILIVSKNYSLKNWTNHERQSAFSRAFNEKREYVLPLRLDDSDIEGLLPTIGYLDLRHTTIKEACKIIYQKLDSFGISPRKHIKIETKKYNLNEKYKEYFRLKATSGRGISGHYIDSIFITRDYNLYLIGKINYCVWDLKNKKILKNLYVKDGQSIESILPKKIKLFSRKLNEHNNDKKSDFTIFNENKKIIIKEKDLTYFYNIDDEFLESIEMGIITLDAKYIVFTFLDEYYPGDPDTYAHQNGGVIVWSLFDKTKI